MTNLRTRQTFRIQKDKKSNMHLYFKALFSKLVRTREIFIVTERLALLVLCCVCGRIWLLVAWLGMSYIGWLGWGLKFSIAWQLKKSKIDSLENLKISTFLPDIYIIRRNKIKWN